MEESLAAPGSSALRNASLFSGRGPVLGEKTVGLIWDAKTEGVPEPPKRRCGAGQMGLELEESCQPGPESYIYPGRH